MKKKSRRPRSSEAPRRTSRTKTTGSVGGEEEEEEEEKKMPGNRGRPRKTTPGTAEGFYSNDTAKGKTTKKHPESKSGSSGRLPAAVCRLCHGKFSPRSLRHAFHKWPQDSVDIVDDESDSAAQPPLLFHADFQRLVGVKLDRDPQLSEFICKKCHSKFYKCHSVLVRFLQRVNLPAVGRETLKTWKKCPEASVNYDLTTPKSFSSDPKCLHNLVSWAHHHGEACTSSPNLKEVLEDQYWGWGSVKAVWACVDGHRYIMDAQCSAPANSQYTMSWYGGALGGGSGEGVMSEEEEEQQPIGFGRTPAGSMSPLAQHSPLALTVQTASSALADWTADAEDFTGHDAALSPALTRLEDAAADSDLSDRFLCEDDFGGTRKALSGEMLESFSDRSRSVTVPNKRRRRNQKTLKEPKIKKKPGPKPGWKNKFKPKGEELPNIYKCPYQGCTAVYKTPDGLKKHIKEHHEEVKERPCPHPGCNKVFMIDRYLQRHVKLIHTEERNHICDQCGQTFKQRKHLSVHQMRHSGAKPLQCEVCGFQCRQRASLKYHMTKHKAEADLDFACLMCEKRFEKAHNLNVHMSMVHPLIQAKVQRGSSQEPPPPEPPEPPPSYAELHADLQAITPTGEMVQQDQDR